MPDKRKLILFIASSLDGYIATQDESLEWLHEVEGEGDNGYSEFYETVDTVLLGKKTYDWIMKLGLDEFPYKDKACYVFSRSAHEDTEDVTFVHDEAAIFVEELKGQEGKHIWIVGGGELLHTFLQAKLVDEIIVTVAPVLIGQGIPLFRERTHQIDLSLKRVKTFNQLVELHYKVQK